MLLVNIAGLLVIGFIVYWFWVAKPEVMKASSGKEIQVLVDGGVYTPSRIEVEAGMPVTLKFLRKDPSPCAEKVIFSDLKVSEDLPINKEKMVKLKVEQPGEYTFTCQMQMYRGSLIVK